MPVIQRGLLRDREMNFDEVVVPQHVVEVSKNVFEVSGGGNVKFVGMIRGGFSEMQNLFPETHPVITYIGPSVEAVTDGLELDEWIYYISEMEPLECRDL
jgi:hypothetical protein